MDGVDVREYLCDERELSTTFAELREWFKGFRKMLVACGGIGLEDVEMELGENISLWKRYEYWDHFVARWAIDRLGGGSGVTGARLRRIESLIITDHEFWFDVIARHDGMTMNPRQLMQEDPENYKHCMGNFWGMIHQTLVEEGFI